MRLCILIVALVMLICCWLTPARTEPMLFLPTLARPATMPTTAPAEPSTQPASLDQ